MLHRFPIRALIPWNNQTCSDIRPMSGLCRDGYWSIAMKRTGILVTACVLLAAPDNKVTRGAVVPVYGRS